MNQFQAVWVKAAGQLSRHETDGSGNGNQEQTQSQAGDSEDATMKIAGEISETILREPLTHEQKKKAGPVVHYAFGALMGAAYGAVVENAPRTKVGAGIPFGATLFALADEVAVPVFGLSKPPKEYPLSTHASALAGHLVYGLTTEAVRRGARQGLRLV